MLRYAFIYGSIAGVAMIATMALILSLGGEGDYGFTEIMGYLVMIGVLSLVFIGTKRFRDIEKGGVIGFGGAFGMGLAIAAIAAVFYVASWEIYLAATDYAFIDSYSDSLIAQIEGQNLSEANRMAAIAEIEASRTLYGKAPFRMMITFVEMFPVGALVALISAAVLRNPKALPARRAA